MGSIKEFILGTISVKGLLISQLIKDKERLLEQNKGLVSAIEAHLASKPLAPSEGEYGLLSKLEKELLISYNECKPKTKLELSRFMNINYSTLKTRIIRMKKKNCHLRFG